MKRMKPMKPMNKIEEADGQLYEHTPYGMIKIGKVDNSIDEAIERLSAEYYERKAKKKFEPIPFPRLSNPLTKG